VKCIVLHDIRSAYNVGAIFRSADGAGVSKVFLSGYTPAPRDRFGRVQREIQKTSLGASESVAWEKIESLASAIPHFQKDGFTVVAIEQSPQSISLRDFIVPDNVVYIVGNEVDGVSSDIQALADTLVDIPMLGAKESLNVSVAASIVLYHDVVSKK
jgi:tRNA G18 (ribose-2'-O)-methylase SpoU